VQLLLVVLLLFQHLICVARHLQNKNLVSLNCDSDILRGIIYSNQKAILTEPQNADKEHWDKSFRSVIQICKMKSLLRR